MRPRLATLDSLRIRVLLVTAGTITLIMMVISWGILAQWRQTILGKERLNAVALARAYSVTVIEAMIAEENDLAQSEGILDNYIAGFVAQNPRLRYIAITGPAGKAIARSLPGRPAWEQLPVRAVLDATEPVTWFRRYDRVGWVQETCYPLLTGQKRWGSLIIGIEADSVRAEIGRSFVQLLGLAVVVTGLMILLLWVLLGRLLGSLHDLVGAMDTLDLEEDPLPALPERRDEIGVLFRHFREMRGRLRRSSQELISAREQVYHAERLAAIGRLASGTAHELNNPINGVRHCIYAIRRDPENRAKVDEYLQMMDEGLEQAASVIGKLLGFARKQQPVKVPVDLNDVVRTTARMLQFDLQRRGITLRLELADALPPLVGDGQLLQEVIMNLLLNAMDAVDGTGEIAVHTSRPAAGRLLARIVDHGRGIAEADLPRIFDPFFTTKGTGEGTGLGLSICLGIVQAHGGTIDVTSRPGEGATFTLEFPASEPNA